MTHTTVAGIPGGSAGGDPGRGWRGWPVGTRVVVRRRLPGGGYADVLGELVAVDDDGVVVRGRRGEVRVPAADIALGKPVPPAPARRAPRVAPPEAAG